MSTKSKAPVLFASVSLAFLLAALFVPLFFGVGPAIVVTVSVWEISPILAILCVGGITAILLVPVIRPSAKSWLLPFIFGVTVFGSSIGAAVYTFCVAEHLSFNLYFHPYGLILLSIGASLCAIEGLVAKSQGRLISAVVAPLG